MNDKSAVTAGSHVSYWTDSLEQPISFSPLTQNDGAQVVIVGGGIAGLSVAYCLSQLNIKVVVVEDGYIGSGETGRTTAHLVNALDDRYYNIEKIFGKNEAKLIAESHTKAIDFIEQTVKKENIDCEFTRLNGYLFLHPTDEDNSLQKELEACLRVGLDVEMQEHTPGLLNKNTQALVFKNQGQFHPLKYLKGLCDAIIRKGGKIFTETHVEKINNTGIITDKGFKISAEYIVVATNSPVNNKYAMHLKQFAYRTYAIGMLVKKNTIPQALWWDTGDFNANENIPPYHYIRTQPYNELMDLLICGGEDHATGLANADIIPEENRYGLLEDWFNKHFAKGEVVFRWSGQVMEPMDSLAFIGHNPWDSDNIYIVTGDSGNGMTHSTIAGMLIADLITGKENPWEKIYNPSRLKIIKVGNVFFKEFAGGFSAYIKDKPKHADEVKLSEIKINEGKIIELEGKKYGAYADEKNKLHLVAAECTHLGCIVKWNNDEKSWDCPCHGSRFMHTGEVINGPANKNLFYFDENNPQRKFNK
ncbi:MAG: puuB 1 [Bacteroidetes bacterium]|nr:puuB 1 [Bacteroidota bacterium]